MPTTTADYSIHHHRGNAQPEELVFTADDEGVRTECLIDVVAGTVSGHIDRTVILRPDGERMVSYGARIDGVRHGNVGVADIEVDFEVGVDVALDMLRALSTVASVLADQIERLENCDR